MTDIHVGIILNGATSGLCRNQHLRALMAIIAEGGLPANDGDRIIPKPMLLGRNAESLRLLADASGGLRWTDDFNAALGSKEDTIFFDVASTGLRYANVCRAIEAGKHVYCEKPIATTLPEAMDLVERAEKAGVKNGTVQDKLFLPGFSKLRKLRESGFFGRIFEVRLEFGRWIFDGEHQPAQRPSWNYRKEAGGGLVLDMFPHWRYMIDNIVGEIKAVSCRPGEKQRPVGFCEGQLRDRRTHGVNGVQRNRQRIGNFSPGRLVAERNRRFDRSGLEHQEIQFNNFFGSCGQRVARRQGQRNTHSAQTRFVGIQV